MNYFSIYCLIFFIFYCNAAPSAQKITNLPGFNISSLNFDMYSGYITIDEQRGKNLFYWFVESQNNPSTDPVLLWLNGGPGASSLLGFFSEHGPFRPQPNGVDLDFYPYSWNKIANIIYLEAPVGVGFSYSNTPSDYTTNDTQTAEDNYVFLDLWFQEYPEFLPNDFYITGESYAGHYCPQVANLLLDHIQDGTSSINMKGLLVGNPVTDDDWYFRRNEWSYFSTLYSHGLLPQEAYVNAYSACEWEGFLLSDNCDDQDNTPSIECLKAVYGALNDYLPYSQIDQFDIYAPICHNSVDFMSKYISKWHPYSRGISMDNNFPTSANVTFYPCIDNYMTVYLNQPSVQQALHVNPTTWDMYGAITYLNESALIMPLYQRFISETDWRILIFSGDVDSAVPFLGTQRWVTCLKQPTVTTWNNWYFNTQVAGAYRVYDGISLLSIKGCGHMVPFYCPERGYDFYERFLAKGEFTS